MSAFFVLFCWVSDDLGHIGGFLPIVNETNHNTSLSLVMESSITSDIDSQITYLQQILEITGSLKEKCIKLEKDKNEALKKSEDLKVKLERLSNKRCTNCSFLMNELKKERKEKQKMKNEERAKLLKTIARTLESLDDGNTNYMNQIFTELVCGRLSESPEQTIKKGITLIEDRDSSKDEDGYNILVNETMVQNENEESSVAFKKAPVIIPETEAMESSPQKVNTKKVLKDISLPKGMNRNSDCLKKSPEKKDAVEQANKKLKLSPILSSQKVSPPRDMTRGNWSTRSPSVLSEIIEATGGSSVPRTDIDSGCQDEKGVAWKMKPSVDVEAAFPSTTGGKKYTQMKLSVTRTEKKLDISNFDTFKGGVARHNDEDLDVINPSPEQCSKRTFVKRPTVCGSLEDPDMTVFNPAVTSTCLPAPIPATLENSYNRLPEIQKSPKYKYRRETVRKRVERLKLPGQDCDQCTKYYEAAGLDQTQEVRARLNQCSRHRDKYNLRANTPPGFWDPVLPASP